MTNAFSITATSWKIPVSRQLCCLGSGQDALIVFHVVLYGEQRQKSFMFLTFYSPFTARGLHAVRVEAAQGLRVQSKGSIMVVLEGWTKLWPFS